MNKHRFVWHELATPDPEASKKFYGEVFRWTFDGGKDGDGYIHIAVGDEMIGGLRQPGADEQVPPSWLAYIGVDDVAATEKGIIAAGGKVHMPTTTMEGSGTFAVVADPAGAVFAVWKSARPGEDVEKPGFPAPFTFCWDELMTTDPAASGAFYEKVFGWTQRPVDMGGGMIYTLLDRPGFKTPKGDPGSAGGMMKSPPDMPFSAWLAYVGVDDCDRVTEHAKRLGATVMMPPTDIPDVGRFAALMDPQQAAISILQPKP